MHINKLYSFRFLSLCFLFSVLLSHFCEVQAADINKTEVDILDSAEQFFLSLKENNYKKAWGLLSEKSHKTIINDVYNTSKNMGGTTKKEDIMKDFTSHGLMFHKYWNAFLANFDPDIVLNESVWEFGTIDSDHAIILLKNRAVTKLHMYKENRQWKVGLVETFWKRRTQNLIPSLLK